MAGAEPPRPGVAPPTVRALRALGRGLLRVPRRLGILPPLAWAGLIFLGSAQPSPSIGATGIAGPVVENFAHAVEYGILAALLVLLAPRREGWVALDRGTVGWILAVVLVYAASDEWHQSFVPHRDASVYDVITDVVGAASTLACIGALGRTREAGRIFSLRFAVGLACCVAAAILATLEP